MRLTVWVLVLGGWDGQPRPHMRAVLQPHVIKLRRPFRLHPRLAEHEYPRRGSVANVDAAEGYGAAHAGHAVACEADADRLRRSVDPILLRGGSSRSCSTGTQPEAWIQALRFQSDGGDWMREWWLTGSTRCSHGCDVPPTTVMFVNEIEMGVEALLSVAVLMEIPPPAFAMKEQSSKEMLTNR